MQPFLNQTKTYKCIIVEDNPFEMKLLQLFISRLPNLEVIAFFTSAEAALQSLQNTGIDLLFLDVVLPDLTGLGLLKLLHHPPKTILTTSSPDYAIEAFNTGVIDYLVKPFTFERFIKAVNRALATDSALTNQRIASLFLKTGRELARVYLDDILFIEAFGALCKIYTPTSIIVVSELLSDLHEKLPSNDFIRVHKSYIAALQKIEKLSAKFIAIQQHQIPLGATYRDQVERSLHER